MKIIVNRDLCESNGVCVRRAPEVFAVDDEERLQVLVEQPGAELADKVRMAVKRCPKAALSLLEE